MSSKHLLFHFLSRLDSKTIIEWDQRLKTPEYRLSIATFLIDKAFFNEPTNFRRIKALMFYLFDKKLLSTYTWAGLGKIYLN